MAGVAMPITPRLDGLIRDWNDSEMAFAANLAHALVPKEKRADYIKAVYRLLPEAQKDEFLSLWGCHELSHPAPPCVVCEDRLQDDSLRN